jgi:hypothetical protein
LPPPLGSLLDDVEAVVVVDGDELVVEVMVLLPQNQSRNVAAVGEAAYRFKVGRLVSYLDAESVHSTTIYVCYLCGVRRLSSPGDDDEGWKIRGREGG